MTGDSANNVIEGGAGGDNISGGGGSDTASYEHSASGVAVNLATGAASGGDAAGDTLSGIANLLGSAFKDTLTGDANANMLSGGGGNDVLDGAVGADTLIGGAGNDAYVLRVGDDQDSIIEQAGGGTDTVRSAVSITSLADNVERIQLVGKANLDASGNDLKNMITGNTADNHINGGGGSDVLTGFGGSDTFVFDTAPGATNVDRITDFNLNDASHHDTIALDQTVFASVGFNQDGSLKDGEFAVIDKTHKPNAEAHLFYNADKDALYSDADGYYGHNATAVQVAVFDGIPTITSDDVHALIS